MMQNLRKFHKICGILVLFAISQAKDQTFLRRYQSNGAVHTQQQAAHFVVPPNWAHGCLGEMTKFA